MSTTIRETEVVVVGGGPIGIAAAIAARLTGLEVTVVERRRPPIDKPCGEGIMPDGAEILEKLGVDLWSRGAVPLAGIELIHNRVRARGRFPGRPGLGVRRTALHEALVQRAEQLGIGLLWGEPVCGLRERGVDLSRGPVEARWVIGADGIDSRLRRSLGLDVPPAYQRFGIRRHYEMAPWTDAVEVHFADDCEAYVTPVARSMICLALLIHDPVLRFEPALARFPRLRRRVESARARSEPLGAATVFRRTSHVVKGRVALVGDAAGSVDAITGAGITLGLHQAMDLARRLKAGDLRPHDAAYRELMRLPNSMTSFMLAASRRPRLRALTLRTLAAAPWILSGLLSLRTGPFRSTCPDGGPPLGPGRDPPPPLGERSSATAAAP
ncbi:MAG: NAD(P)/FAD-dependent oxidoreductase [Acidobacteriota bacterium]